MTFPLPLSHLHVLLDLLAPASSSLAQLREILAVDLPPDSAGRPTFPVRITFPVYTQVNAQVTFQNFQARGPGEIADDVFAIPDGMQRR